MDLSFLHFDIERNEQEIETRFNPCSYGSFVLTWRNILEDFRKGERFNPCSYGSFVLTELQNRRSLAEQNSFNPCFYGSFVLTHRRKVTLLHSCISFNPCSYGSFVLTKGNWEKHIKRFTKFQSLFLWIFRSYSGAVSTLDRVRELFQSLFLWIFRSYLVWIAHIWISC